VAEYRLFDGPVPFVSTAEFHADRERAPHLEQDVHRPRLEKAADFVTTAATTLHCQGNNHVTVSDLGCGDGGLLSLLLHDNVMESWGYDFQPSNQSGWIERGVRASKADVFGADRDNIEYGDIVVCTEVLEHLADPHGALRHIAGVPRVRYLVASSPWTETPESHDACHCWAWDQTGYRELVEQAGFTVLRHAEVGMFQVVMAVKA
jgi:hypothetical protein